MIAGKDAPTHGEGKNSWLTGTAAWTFLSISQHILGIRPEFDGLRVDPCIPSNVKSFSCVRKFRGSTYNITVDNPDGVQKGIASVKINGKECDCTDGALIRVPEVPSEIDINIVMG